MKVFGKNTGGFWKVTALSLALVMALAALGCGDGDDESGNKGTTLINLKLPTEDEGLSAAASRSVLAAANGQDIGESRTLFPDTLSTWKYTVSFEYMGGTPGPAGWFSHDAEVFPAATSLGVTSKQVSLEVGTWKFVANGYIVSGGTETKVAESAPKQSPSVEGTTSTVNLTLGPIAGGLGTFTYNVTLPAAANSGGSVTVTKIDGTPVTPSSGTNPAPLTPSSVSSSSMTLPSGEYLVVAKAGGDKGWAAVTHVAHIYQNQETKFAWSPNGDEISNSVLNDDDLDLTNYVKVPAAGADISEAYTSFTREDDKYSGVIEWFLYDDTPVTYKFQGQTIHYAKVTLTAGTRYTFAGVPENGWKHRGKDFSIEPNPKNAADSGIVFIWFPQTGGTAPASDITVKLGFNYEEGAIEITNSALAGNTAAVIYRNSSPNSVSFTVQDDPADKVPSVPWQDIVWYGDGQPYTTASAGVSLENSSKTLQLSAAGLILGLHQVLFTGRKGTFSYAKALSVRVSETPPAAVQLAASPFDTEASVNGVTFSNSKFIAVAEAGKYSSSTDGINWTTQASSGSAHDNVSVAGSGDGKFIIGKTFGLIASSTDNGVTWTSISAANSKLDSQSSALAAAYGAGKFVVASGKGLMTYSADGLTWTQIPAGSSGTQFTDSDSIYALVYRADGKFVAAGANGKIAYSTNGTAWTAAANSTFGTSKIYALAASDSLFVAGGADGKLAYSADGASWTAVEFSGFTSSAIKALSYGGGRFLAAGENGKMAYSADGVLWTTVPSGDIAGLSRFTSSETINGLTYGAGKFVATGSNGKIAYWSYP